MSKTKSTKKAWRQSLKKRTHNLFYKKKIKTLLREVRNLVFQKKIEKAKKLLPEIYKILDKAVKEKVIKKNTADRKKTRITKLINRNI